MRRDPFVYYRSWGSVGIAAPCIVVRDMLQTRLILCTSAWWGRRVLLDERFAPHDGGEAERRSRPTLTATRVITTQQYVTSTSGLRNLSLSRNVWQCQYQYATRLTMERFRVATPACEQMTDARDATFRCRE
jgi:hypothetical protein